MALLSLKVSVDYPFCYGRPLINNYTDEHDYNLVLLYRVCSIKFHCAIKRAKSVFSFLTVRYQRHRNSVYVQSYEEAF